MVFAVYAMVCFMMPYLDFGIPGNLRANMFYFLLTIGLLSFSVVVAIYYRAHQELKKTLDQIFYLGLSRHLGEGLSYLKNVPDYDKQLWAKMWGLDYNQFEARNLLQGTFKDTVFSWVHATVEQRSVDSLRSDKVIFEGMILKFELRHADHPKTLIIGRSHPSFARLVTKARPLVDERPSGLTPRFFMLTDEDWVPGAKFVHALTKLDESLRLHRVIRKDLIIVIQDGFLTVAVPVYDRLWEMIHWRPFETEVFLSRQLLPLTAIKTLADIRLSE